MVLQEGSRKTGCGLELKVSQDGKEGVDRCPFSFLLTAVTWPLRKRKELREMMMEATVGLRRRGLVGEEMEFVA